MTEDEHRGPRLAAQWDSIPAPELARLRRIEAVAEAMLEVYDESSSKLEEPLEEAVEALRDAVAP
jgi:hypothetical protein